MEYNNPHLDAQQFEQAIDHDPFQSINHLAYADWLDDRDEHNEAAFRRSMGNWIHRQNPHEITPWEAFEGSEAIPQSHTTHTVWGTLPTADLPQGVTHFPFRSEDNEIEGYDPEHESFNPANPLGSNEQRTGVTLIPQEEHHPNFIQYDVRTGPYTDNTNKVTGHDMRASRFEWPNYRSMERSFRESFYHNLEHNRQRMMRDRTAKKALEILIKRRLLNAR